MTELWRGANVTVSIAMFEIDIERLREIDRNQVFLARCHGLMRVRVGKVFAKLAEKRKYKELGFNSIAPYAKERLSRSGRWLSESRTVAVRLEELPLVLRAFEQGEFGWCVLELLCRHATPENQLELIWRARQQRVRELRKGLAEGPNEEDDPERERASIVRRMQADHAWSFEAALRLADHLGGGCGESDALEWLLAEGTTSLIAEAPEVADISEALKVRAAEKRERMAKLAKEREDLEAELEDDLPREVIAGYCVFDPDAPIPDDPNELDRMLRELCATLDAADVWLGKSLSIFFSGRQWERLGYASDGQYCRERLHMSRSSAWERVALARSTTRFDHIVDAIYGGEIGTCAARMLARIVTPETEHAWVERAKVRTFKHLSEEIELVSMDVRLLGEDANRYPPDDERIRRYHEWQREVLSGEAFRKAAETGEPIRMSARSADAESETRHAGLVDMPLRSRADVIDFYQVLEDAFNRSGIDDTFESWLAKSFTDTWDRRSARAIAGSTSTRAISISARVPCA